MQENWRPATPEFIASEMEKQLLECSELQRIFFTKMAIPFSKKPVMRYGQLEFIYVIAQIENCYICYEDIEEGFELVELDESGTIKELGVNQFRLSHLLAQRLKIE